MWLEDAQVPGSQCEISAAGPYYTLRPPAAAAHTHDGHATRSVVDVCVPEGGRDGSLT